MLCPFPPRPFVVHIDCGKYTYVALCRTDYVLFASFCHRCAPARLVRRGFRSGPMFCVIVSSMYVSSSVQVPLCTSSEEMQLLTQSDVHHARGSLACSSKPTAHPSTESTSRMSDSLCRSVDQLLFVVCSAEMSRRESRVIRTGGEGT
jgi:hypothetical protein